MRLGVHVMQFDYPGGPATIGPTLAEIGEAAEEAGLGVLSVMDHYWQMIPVGGPELNMLEAYTTLGFLAAATKTVELQVLVTGITYRPPGLLAKIITTLDVLSGGRAVLGIGAAWYEEEHRGLGVEFPPTAERFERLEETLEIVKQMWSGDDAPYDGTHYHLGRTLNLPAPIRRPPIMIGGSGEKKTLRLVAKHADACNLFTNPDEGPSFVAHKLDVLREHCEAEGTDYDAIRKTIIWGSSPGDDFADQMAPYAELGITQVHVRNDGQDPAGTIRRLGERVVPSLSEV